MRDVSFGDKYLILWHDTHKHRNPTDKINMSNENLKASSPKEQVKQEIRRRIIEAGTRAFAKLGYHGMKIAAVARDAGIANGTFYLHFKDKQTLFLEILKHAVGKLTASLFSVHGYGDQASGSEREEITVIFDFAEQNRDLMRIALNTDSSELLKGVDIFEPIVEMRIKQIKKGIESGQASRSINPLIAARAEIGMLMSVILWWFDNKEKTSKADVIETLTVLKKSWLATDSEKVEDIDSMLAHWDSRL